MLHQGIRKRIGDGKNVNIWEDKWFHEAKNGEIKIKKRNTGLTKVCELIHNGEWNEKKLTAVFDREDVDRIKKIPFGIYPMKDQLYRMFSPSGEYTVKSGYKLTRFMMQQRKKRRGDETSSSRNTTGTQCWKLLWNLNMQPKLKHFVWKCLQRILPVNEVLKQRCGKDDYMCKGCGEWPETLKHMLFYCKQAQMIWKLAPVNWSGIQHFCGNFWLWWEGLMEAQKGEQGMDRIVLTVHLLWQIWKARNALSL